MKKRFCDICEKNEIPIYKRPVFVHEGRKYTVCLHKYDDLYSLDVCPDCYRVLIKLALESEKWI